MTNKTTVSYGFDGFDTDDGERNDRLVIEYRKWIQEFDFEVFETDLEFHVTGDEDEINLAQNQWGRKSPDID